MHEKTLRDYLAENIFLIEKELSLIGTEVSFPGGRYDILARRNAKNIAIELKSRPYNTNQVIAQLNKYFNAIDTVYFLAPKVKYGVFLGMKNYKNFRMFEIDSDLSVKRVFPSDLDDKRAWPELTLTRDYSPLDFITEKMSEEGPFARFLVNRVLEGFKNTSL